MLTVIFEVTPLPGQAQRYFDIAAALAGELQRIDGFVSVERFQSLADPEKILSLSFFRDEAAVARWRAAGPHRQAQAAGRDHVFARYRLRVAAVLRDYGMDERERAPADSRAVHDAQ